MTNAFLRGFLPGFLGLAFILSIHACSTRGALTAVAKGIEVAACVAENQDQPKPVLYAKCLTENVTVDDIDHMLQSQQLATARYMAQKTSGPQDAGVDAR